jgi:hypothetical protein
MDQVRKILAVIKKHHFWMLTGIGASIVFVCWFIAQGQIDAAYTKNKQEIEGKFGSVKSLASNASPPSEGWAPEVAKLTEGLTKDVTDAWNVVYERQKSVLTWPEVLGPEFATSIQAIKDKKSSEGPAPQLSEADREQYMTIFAGQMGLNVGGQLAKIIDARKDESELMATGATAVSANPADLGGTVVWDPASKLAIETRFTWVDAPSTEEILLAQEDFWVLQSLFGVIRDVNAGSEGRFNAPIKTLLTVQVGNEAAIVPGMGVDKGRVEWYGADESAAGGYGAAGAAAPVGDPSAGEILSAVDMIKLNRYVNKEGAPKEAEAAASEHIKMLPINMTMIVDQRRVPELLAACTNAPLPVEVTAVRFQTRAMNDEDPSGTSSGGGGYGAPGGGRGGYGPPGGRAGYGPPPRTGAIAPVSPLRLVGFDYQLAQAGYGPPPGARGGYGMPGGGGYGRTGGAGGYGGGAGMGGSGGASLLSEDPELLPQDIYLELRGIVHIYNPPDPEALANPSSGGGEEEAAPAEEDLASAN